jgi:hypothetical protein
MMATKVFLCYRRDDSAGYAGRVQDRLVQEFGRNLLFMDVDSIPLGVNFIKVLQEEVAAQRLLVDARLSLRPQPYEPIDGLANEQQDLAAGRVVDGVICHYLCPHSLALYAQGAGGFRKILDHQTCLSRPREWLELIMAKVDRSLFLTLRFIIYAPGSLKGACNVITAACMLYGVVLHLGLGIPLDGVDSRG